MLDHLEKIEKQHPQPTAPRIPLSKNAPTPTPTPTPLSASASASTSAYTPASTSAYTSSCLPVKHPPAGGDSAGERALTRRSTFGSMLSEAEKRVLHASSRVDN
eukprot:8750377-Pyramimonas_sp.AAC.1